MRIAKQCNLFGSSWAGSASCISWYIGDGIQRSSCRNTYNNRDIRFSCESREPVAPTLPRLQHALVTRLVDIDAILRNMCGGGPGHQDDKMDLNMAETISLTGGSNHENFTTKWPCR